MIGYIKLNYKATIYWKCTIKYKWISGQTREVQAVDSASLGITHTHKAGLMGNNQFTFYS